MIRTEHRFAAWVAALAILACGPQDQPAAGSSGTPDQQVAPAPQAAADASRPNRVLDPNGRAAGPHEPDPCRSIACRTIAGPSGHVGRALPLSRAHCLSIGLGFEVASARAWSRLQRSARAS
jgi:hypothetical protein